MRAAFPLVLLTACLPEAGPQLSLAEMHDATGVYIDAHESYVFDGPEGPVVMPPTLIVDLDTPDCARFRHGAHVTVAGKSASIDNPTGEGVDCVMAQATVTLPVGTFTGQPVEVEIGDSTDTWTITFAGFANENLTLPATLARNNPATMTWQDGPHIDNGCFRLSDPFDGHGCKFDSNIRFPASPGNTVEIDVSPIWPAQTSIKFDLVGEYSVGSLPASIPGAGPPTACEGPLGCRILMAVERDIAVSIQ